MVLNKEEIAPEIHAKIASNEEVISNNLTKSDSNLNWNTYNQNKENIISNEVVHADLYSDDLAIADTEVVGSNKDASPNFNVGAVGAVGAATDDDDNNLNAKFKLDGENLIGNLNGIQQEYLTEYVIPSHSNNYSTNIDKEIYINDRNNTENPPPLSSKSNTLCIYSIFGEVKREFQFWNDI